MSLLEQLKNSSESMGLTDRILGSFQVTLLGMTIVFTGLFVLYLVISIVSRFFINKNEKPPEKKQSQTVAAPAAVKEPSKNTEMDQSQLISVITAAVASSLNTSAHQIVVKNIVRIGQPLPWANAGLQDQMAQSISNQSYPLKS